MRKVDQKVSNFKNKQAKKIRKKLIAKQALLKKSKSK